MHSQRFCPHPALRDYVSAYILSDYGCADKTTCIYPAGSAILCFSLDSPFTFREISSGRIIQFSRFNFIPQFKQARFYEVIAGPTKVLHVIFEPYGAYRLLGIPQNCPFDKHGISLIDMLVSRATPLLNQIEDAAYDINLIIQMLDDWLKNQLAKNEKIDVSRVGYACKLIEASNGTLPIEQLTQNMRVSKRVLEYQFQEQVGLSPKLFSRITRFNALFTIVKSSGDTDWQEVLFKYNYFDQAHLIREFKYFSGSAPSRLPATRPILNLDL